MRRLLTSIASGFWLVTIGWMFHKECWIALGKRVALIASIALVLLLLSIPSMDAETKEVFSTILAWIGGVCFALWLAIVIYAVWSGTRKKTS